MDTVEFLESVTDMWNQGNPKFWEMMQRRFSPSNKDLVGVMNGAWWGHYYLKYQLAVRETFLKYPSRFLTNEYRREKQFPQESLEDYVGSENFRIRFKQGIRDYFLNHFNPNNIVSMYVENHASEKEAVKRIKESGKKGIWFLTFPDGVSGSKKAFFDWDTIKTLLELNEPFVLGYSELLDSPRVMNAKLGFDGLEDIFLDPTKVISWDFNCGQQLYWNLNQQIHLITRTGMTFQYGDLMTSFMNWKGNPF